MTDSISQRVDAQGIESLRPTLRGTRHMAVAGHPGAAHAAFAILEAGGNAIDAGVAGGIALGVLQSDLVNVAGVAPIMIYVAKTREVVTISGLGTWPRAITPDYFAKHCGGRIPHGVLRTVVPAAIDAWITALERYGTMSFGDCASAAIRFARDGFPMYALMSDMIAMHVDDYRCWPSSAEVYLPRGRVPQPGEVFVQRDLGATLQYLADEERAASNRGRAAGLQAVRDAFYRGDVAHAIVAYHREHGGLLALDDLAGFRVALEPPVCSRFGALDVYACGAWCQAPVLLELLNIVDGIDLAALGHNSAAYLHLLIEADKLAGADRITYTMSGVDPNTLLSDSYVDQQRQRIARERASLGQSDHYAAELAEAVRAGNPAAASRDHTTHFGVADASGMAVNVTQSIGSPFGSAFMAGETGIMLNNFVNWTDLDRTSPNAMEPAKKMENCMSPAQIYRDGRFYATIGTPGSWGILQTTPQMILNLLVFGMNVQEAIEAPRFRFLGGRKIAIEARVPEDVRARLEALGHEIQLLPELSWAVGGGQGTLRDPESGVLMGGADPRRDGYVAAC